MKTNTWLIQNICHPYKTGTDLCGQSYSLGFSAGQCTGGTTQRKIIQTYLCKETNSCPDFFQNLFSDQFLLFCKSKICQEFTEVFYGKICYFINILISYSYSKRFSFQTLSFTGLTWGDTHKSLIFLFHGI